MDLTITPEGDIESTDQDLCDSATDSEDDMSIDGRLALGGLYAGMSGSPESGMDVAMDIDEPLQHEAQLTPRTESVYFQDLSLLEMPDEPLWRLPDVEQYSANRFRTKQLRSDVGDGAAFLYHRVSRLIRRRWHCTVRDALPRIFHNTTPYSLALLIQLKQLTNQAKNNMVHAHNILHGYWEQRVATLDVSGSMQQRVFQSTDARRFTGCEREVQENLYGITFADVHRTLQTLICENRTRNITADGSALEAKTMNEMSEQMSRVGIPLAIQSNIMGLDSQGQQPGRSENTKGKKTAKKLRQREAKRAVREAAKQARSNGLGVATGSNSWGTASKRRAYDGLDSSAEARDFGTRANGISSSRDTGVHASSGLAGLDGVAAQLTNNSGSATGGTGTLSRPIHLQFPVVRRSPRFARRAYKDCPKRRGDVTSGPASEAHPPGSVARAAPTLRFGPGGIELGNMTQEMSTLSLQQSGLKPLPRVPIAWPRKHALPTIHASSGGNDGGSPSTSTTIKAEPEGARQDDPIKIEDG